MPLSGRSPALISYLPGLAGLVSLVLVIISSVLNQAIAGETHSSNTALPSRPAPAHMRLTGRIVHSEVLPQLSADQSVGKLFSGPDVLRVGLTKESKPKQLMVPAWLAGTWSRTNSVEISRIKLPQGQRARPLGPSVAIVEDVFGTYKDARGIVWQSFDPARSMGQIDRGAVEDYHFVFGYNLEVFGARMAVVEVQARHMVVDKKTRKIQAVYQDEELNTYTLVADGQVRTDSSVKAFDWHGKPLLLTRSLSSEIRTAPFHERAGSQAPPADKK